MNTERTQTLWSDTFNKTLEIELGYNDSWVFQFNDTLQDNLSTEEKRTGWKIYRHSAYGKFRCDRCSRSWTSAQVTVLFHYRLCRGMAQGTVTMRPFGQACQRCKGRFQLPGFSKEEVQKVLLKLISKIKKNCYGENQNGNSNSSFEKVFTKPHESSLCEACSQGICCVED